MPGKKNKRALKCTGMAVLLALLVVCVVRIYRVNQSVPQVKMEVLAGDGPVQWKDQIEITVRDMYFMDDAAIRKTEGIEKRLLFPSEMKLMWVTVGLENTGSKAQQVQLLELGAESQGWSNLPDLDFYYAFGDVEQEVTFELQAGEETVVKLPYLLLRDNYRKREWEKAEQKEYFITWKLYPVKRMISIPKAV